MNRNAITDAIKARADTLGLSIAYPNVAHDGVRPFVELTFPASERDDQTLKGTRTQETGRVSFLVVSDERTAVKASEDTADAISDLFPMGLRIPITDGEITITQPASIRGGFQGDNDWRVPVIVPYVAIAT